MGRIQLSRIAPALLLLIAAGCRSGEQTLDADPASAAILPVRFTDVTPAVGISFRHENGAAGRKYMPETMGSGCAFLDYDSDGWQDILLINGQPWSGVQVFGPGTRAERDGTRDGRPERPTMALYRNDGTGRFRDV